MKSFCVTLCLVSVSALLFAGVVFAYMFLAASPQSGTVEIRVEQGEPFSAVVRKLREHKVVTNERLFSLWARYSGLEKKIHRGLYRFELPLSPSEVLNRMVLGQGIFQRVTIPEGLTVKEVGDLLAKMGIVQQQQFFAAAQDPELLASLGLTGTGIEGYLFPNTYNFIPDTPPREIILKMAEQFRKTFEPLAGQRKENLTPHEIVTLASIIEKETGVEAERPLVSAVFYNRLKLRMPLQSDPTVIYGLKEFNGNLTRKDLHASSPYNTYRIIFASRTGSSRRAVSLFCLEERRHPRFLGKSGVAQSGSQSLSAAHRNYCGASQIRLATGLATDLWRPPNMV
jgi:UPF0755 protein